MDYKNTKSGKIIHILASLLLAIGMIIPASPVHAQAAETLVFMDPAVSSIVTGDVVTVSVKIQDVVNLYGGDIRFSFDPTVFEVIDENTTSAGIQMASGGFLQAGWMINYARNTETDTPSYIPVGNAWFVVSQLNPAEPKSGSGTLFSFRLRSKKAVVDSPLTIIYSKLADRDGLAISATMTGATITVRDPGDLIVTKSDGLAEIEAGQAVAYSIVVTNAGANAVVGASVTDTMPAALQSVSWTCSPSSEATCAASGAGDISDTVNIPIGGSVTYTVNATVDAAFTGELTNSASAALPASMVDIHPADNTASDVTSVLKPSADLAVAKTDGLTEVDAGKQLTYTITVTNNGANAVIGAAVTDNMPSGLEAVTWTCVGAGGAVCMSSGSGYIADTVNLPVGGIATYTVSATVKTTYSGNLTNTASAAVPTNMRDIDPTNNSASDTTHVQPTIPVTGGIFYYVPIIQKP